MVDNLTEDQEAEINLLAGIAKGKFGRTTDDLNLKIATRKASERRNTRTDKEQNRSKNKRSKSLNLRTTPDFHAGLKLWAAAAGMTASNLIETAVHEYVKRKKLDKKG